MSKSVSQLVRDKKTFRGASFQKQLSSILVPSQTLDIQTLDTTKPRQANTRHDKFKQANTRHDKT